MSEDLWGERVGDARLCDSDGLVRSDPRYPDGYHCTGGHHVGPSRYIRCTNPVHDSAGRGGRQVCLGAGALPAAATVGPYTGVLLTPGAVYTTTTAAP